VASPPSVSVIIRAKDEEAGIGRTLDLLARQSQRPSEVIVVDSGSKDSTPAIAQAKGARLIQIPSHGFSYGGSLNTGCAAATGDILVALSAHAFPTSDTWIADLVDAMGGHRVACATGVDRSYDGSVPTQPIAQDATLYRAHPTWGYSNAAGAFRADLWKERGFREDMPFSEDKEWALFWLDRGWVSVLDPRLGVEHSHSRDPILDQYRRAWNEARGLSMYTAWRPPTVGETAREWWRDHGAYSSRWRARLSHRRMSRLAGRYAGGRAVRRDRARAADEH
jgi:rhamnosyltransferase